jgi:hypothetical protein
MNPSIESMLGFPRMSISNEVVIITMVYIGEKKSAALTLLRSTI